MARFADLGESAPTLDAAAERLGISPTAVEKDYWVSQVLRVLGRDFGGDFIFKGGTSFPRATGWWSDSPKTSTSSSCRESGAAARPTSS